MVTFETSAQVLSALIGAYDRIVLLANNPDVDLPASPGAVRTLYVFLNRAEPLAKVGQFDQDCLIITGKSGPAVFSLEGERVPVLGRIAPGRCKAIAVLVTQRTDLARPRNWDGPWLQLQHRTPWPYPPAIPKSTGFIALNYLVHCAGGREIALAGFNGRGSTRRKLPARHDWVYEQLYIRLLAESGRITLVTDGGSARDQIELLRRAFPEIGAEQFDKVLHSYAAEEMTYFKGALHGIIRILRPITLIRKGLHFG
jgi:hypothetical protein